MWNLDSEARGADYFRAILARAASGKGSEIEYATKRYGERVAYLVRTAVAAGDSSSGAWGAILVTPEAQEFFGAVEQASVVGRLGLHPVTLNCRTILLCAGASAYWVGSGRPKPISKADLIGDTLPPRKVVALYLITKELARLANASAEGGQRNDLVRTLGETIDLAFLDPANPGVTDEQPASVTNGVVPIASAGSPEADIAALIAAFMGDLAAASFVCDPVTASQIALAHAADGGFAFPDASPRGGSILGMPLIVSRSSPRDSSGGMLALIDGSGIAYGAQGIRSTTSENASLMMDDGPSSPATQVSLFQTNSVAVLSEMAVNWKVVRDGAVVYISHVDYGVGS